jgi:uncharacterized protein
MQQRVAVSIFQMKLHLQSAAANVVTGRGPGWVRVGQVEYRHNLILLPDSIIETWAPGGFAALSEADFGALLQYKPEMVLLGTGDRQHFPHPRLYAPLTAARIGVEVMDTAAACRTFNILIAEERRVLAALVVA